MYEKVLAEDANANLGTANVPACYFSCAVRLPAQQAGMADTRHSRRASAARVKAAVVPAGMLF